ncbi:recombinase family protein [Pseudomonas sp. LS44]|uniref:recombinase family protein n=1 Tax=Pseudomonas sp. LS44 TaxID=1357074 RepID=UPI00215AC076|nr:recombinase family protein [Pseudomonas sp. LS44]UVE16148.1 recombinase family protein [Pseudomonas sp. LS44]
MTPKPRFVRAYLRASTVEQDVDRARQMLVDFAQEHGQHIAAFYLENESGTKLHRPELFRLLRDAQPGDILLCEQVDRLSRLEAADWLQLRSIIAAKELHIVALDLPTSHQFLAEAQGDSFTGRMLSAINSMLLDMLAAVARKDYEDRRRRTLQGIAKAQAQGKYKGRPINGELHDKIKACLRRGMPIRETAAMLDCAKSTVQRVKQDLERDNCPA